MGDKVIIIGLDGATFALLDPWLDEGRLPHLQRMIREGVRGDLESCVPPVTAPAWTSFFTGKNPGKHGVFDFVRQDKNDYEFHPVNSNSYHGKTLWEVIGDQGKRVVVLNVPMTHPASDVNGVLISDFLLATSKGRTCHPAGRLEEIEESFGTYPTETVPPYFAGGNAEEDIARFVQEYRDAMHYKFRVAGHLLEQERPDFLMLHLFGNDQICHWLWHMIDVEHPKYEEEESRKHLERILEYYLAFDAELGLLLDRIDDDVSLFIVSDHGFGPVHRSIDFNTWLYQEGYLALKERPSTRLRRLAWKLGLTPQALMDRDWFLRLVMGLFLRLKKKRSGGNVDDLKQAHSLMRLFLSFQDIDWSRTRAFSPFGFGQIRIHVRGQWSQGCVSEGSGYEETRREIVEKLRVLKDPDTGEVLDGAVMVKEEVFEGDFLEEAPDILFIPTQGKYRPKSTGFSSSRVFASSGWMTGIHRMSGVLIGRGRGLNHGQRLDGARITDVFPSVLALMGLEIPGDVDGRIPDRMFTDAFLQAHPVRRGSASTQTKQSPAEGDRSNEEGEVMDRLKTLGYLD